MYTLRDSLSIRATTEFHVDVDLSGEKRINIVNMSASRENLSLALDELLLSSFFSRGVRDARELSTKACTFRAMPCC